MIKAYPQKYCRIKGNEGIILFRSTENGEATQQSD